MRLARAGASLERILSEDEPTHELAGGGTHRVVRVGETVRRPRTAASEAVARLLSGPRTVGFTAAPRFLGVDERGRDCFDYLPGRVGNYPLTEGLRSERALLSAARLLREYHSASAMLCDELAGARWWLSTREPVEVICHGDFAPYNCVFAGDRAVGLIDFDTAHPRPRIWDVAYAVYRFAPLTHPENPDGFGTPEQQAERCRLFLAEYGPVHGDVFSVAMQRLHELVRLMHAEADRGDSAFAAHVADGHDRVYSRDAEYLADHPGW